MAQIAESRTRAWIVPAPLVIWSIHFMLCYITAALWCGRVVGRLGPLSTAATAIAIYSIIALAGVIAIGWHGYRAQRLGGSAPPHDADSPEDRHRFLGLATLLIAGLSTVAILYSAMAVLFVRTCQ